MVPASHRINVDPPGDLASHRTRGMSPSPEAFAEFIIGRRFAPTRWLRLRRLPHGRGEVSAERAHPRIQMPAHLLLFARATSLNRAPGSNVMAKGQMRSNKE